MKPMRFLSLMLLSSALLISSFTQPAFGAYQTNDQVRTPAEGSAERAAIMDAVRELYKAGDDKPTKFQVNYLKVHNGWAWINVTPLNDGGTPVGDPAPLLFQHDNGKWTARDLNDVAVEGDLHGGSHDPNAKYVVAVQKKYPGVPSDIFPVMANTNDPILTIRDQYATINRRAAKYKKVKKELTGYSLEGGELVAYFDGPKIMKIVANHYGEGGKALEEYYYWDDQLIFVFRKDSSYDKPGSGKVVRTAENRFYFTNDRMIRWIAENSKQIASGDSEFVEKEKDYLKNSKEFTDGARSKKAMIEAAP